MISVVQGESDYYRIVLRLNHAGKCVLGSILKGLCSDLVDASVLQAMENHLGDVLVQVAPYLRSPSPTPEPKLSPSLKQQQSQQSTVQLKQQVRKHSPKSKKQVSSKRQPALTGSKRLVTDSILVEDDSKVALCDLGATFAAPSVVLRPPFSLF